MEAGREERGSVARGRMSVVSRILSYPCVWILKVQGRPESPLREQVARRYCRFTSPFDSSVGRAVDCSWQTAKQASIGHWFESGSKEELFDVFLCEHLQCALYFDMQLERKSIVELKLYILAGNISAESLKSNLRTFQIFRRRRICVLLQNNLVVPNN